MLVPLSWLRDFAPFDLDPVALGDTFDDLGMVVEGITRVGEGLDAVVVSRVVSIEAIPGADKIRKVMVEADVVYDLAIETNRPDAMCIAGVARDTAAKLGLPFIIPDWTPIKAAEDPSLASVALDAVDLSPRFSAWVFRGASVGPSSPLVARRLTLAGMRPISNLVDASNYVMLELGQPTHP